MSIYEALKTAGVKLDNHASDLYAEVTPISAAIVATYEHRPQVTTFRSAIDGRLWFDLPFAYQPYWQGRDGHVHR